MRCLHGKTDREIRTMIKLSIIVPVYEAEQYIEDCLTSLLQQNVEQYEIICIDDGSTDHSGIIIKTMAERFPVIQYYYQENHGVSSARNYGLRVASGDYIMFVDADDFLKKNKLRMLLKKAEESQADILVFGGQADQILLTPEWVKEAFFTRNKTYIRQSTRALFYESGSRPSVCNKLFSRGVLENQYFPEDVVASEDLAFLFQVFPKAENVVFCSEDVYRYRISNETSAMHRIDGKNVIYFENHMRTLECIVQHWKQIGILEKEKADLRAWMFSFLDYLYRALTESQKQAYDNRLEYIFQQLDVLKKEGFERLEKPIVLEKMSLGKFLRSVKYQMERYGFFYGTESFFLKIYTYLKK